LRQEIYKKAFNKLIYQNLTRKEKKQLRTSLRFDYSTLKSLKVFPHTKFTVSVEKSLKILIETNEYDDFE
jgi:hypothetical protein